MADCARCGAADAAGLICTDCAEERLLALVDEGLAEMVARPDGQVGWRITEKGRAELAAVAAAADAMGIGERDTPT